MGRGGEVLSAFAVPHRKSVTEIAKCQEEAKLTYHRQFATNTDTRTWIDSPSEDYDVVVFTRSDSNSKHEMIQHWCNGRSVLSLTKRNVNSVIHRLLLLPSLTPSLPLSLSLSFTGFCYELSLSKQSNVSHSANHSFHPHTTGDRSHYL